MAKKFTLVFLFTLAVFLTISACSTKTPAMEPTATITPTATPLPDPEWSYMKSDDTEDSKSLAFDQDGYLWVIGYGGVMRWDVDAETYLEYTENDGLGRAARKSILVDEDNRVWVAADDGLYMFDGESWTSYPSSTPLGNGRLLAGAADNLWYCGTEGMFQFDGEGWTQHGVETGLPSDECYSMAIDLDGNPWVIAADNTLSHYTGQWDSIDLLDTEIAVVDIHSNIHVAPNGDLWLPTKNHVIHVPANQDIYNDYQIAEEEESISAFTLSFSGTPWVAHIVEGKSIFQAFNGTEWAVIMPSGGDEGVEMSFNLAMADPDGAIWFICSDFFIRTMQHDWTMFTEVQATYPVRQEGAFSEDGRLFFAAAEGVIALGESREDITRFDKPLAAMASNEVDDIQIDDDGNVYTLLVDLIYWYDVKNIIQVYDGAAWTTLFESETYKSTWSHGWVQKILAVQDGLLYHPRTGLSGLRPDGTAIDGLDQPPPYIQDFIRDDRGNIWLCQGYKEDAISRWDGDGWETLRIDLPGETGEDVRFWGLYRVFLSPQGILWFAVDDDNQWLVSYDDATGTWTNYPPDPRWEDLYGYHDYLIDDVQFNTEDMPVVLLVDDIHELDATSIYEYRDGVWDTLEFDGAAIRTIRYHADTLWVGTERNGVYYRDDSGSGEWEQLDDSTWEGGTHVTLIAPGAENDLWIATQESINLLRDGIWTYFPQGEEGFIDVNCMAVAPDGAVWFGSDSQGIARYGIPW